MSAAAAARPFAVGDIVAPRYTLPRYSYGTGTVTRVYGGARTGDIDVTYAWGTVTHWHAALTLTGGAL